MGRFSLIYGAHILLLNKLTGAIYSILNLLNFGYLESNPFSGIEFLAREITPRYHISR